MHATAILFESLGTILFLSDGSKAQRESWQLSSGDGNKALMLDKTASSVDWNYSTQ